MCFRLWCCLLGIFQSEMEGRRSMLNGVRYLGMLNLRSSIGFLDIVTEDRFRRHSPRKSLENRNIF
jgi:hypothetical protein